MPNHINERKIRCSSCNGCLQYNYTLTLNSEVKVVITGSCKRCSLKQVSIILFDDLVYLYLSGRHHRRSRSIEEKLGDLDEFESKIKFDRQS